MKLLFASEYDDFGFQEGEGSGCEGKGVHSYIPAADLSSALKIHQAVTDGEEDSEEDGEED